MNQLKFHKDLYSKIALLKAAYNYTDSAYIHLDCDERYYYVTLEPKQGTSVITEQEFQNEMLAQSVRHEVYQQTKTIRELLLARAMATSVLIEDGIVDQDSDDFTEDEILKDWFSEDEKIDS